MNTIQFLRIEAGSPAYEEMITLRMAVLLDPIGIPRSYIDPEKERTDILLGAYNNGQLIGCCILTNVNGTTVQLRQMAVAAFYQQKGLGRALLLFAEAVAQEEGYRFCRLHARDTVTPFYRKAGYVPTGEPFFEVGIGHQAMQKNLSATHQKEASLEG